MHAGLPVADRVERAARAEGDHRPPGGLRFNRRDAEILVAGKDECFATRHQAGQIGVWHAPHKSDRRPGHRSQPVYVTPVAGDPQRALQPVEGFNRQVDALVGDQPRGDQIEVFGRCRRPVTG